MHAYTHARMHACIHTYPDTSIHICAYPYLSIHVYTHTHTYSPIPISTHIHPCHVYPCQPFPSNPPYITSHHIHITSHHITSRHITSHCAIMPWWHTWNWRKPQESRFVEFLGCLSSGTWNFFFGLRTLDPQLGPWEVGMGFCWARCQLQPLRVCHAGSDLLLWYYTVEMQCGGWESQSLTWKKQFFPHPKISHKPWVGDSKTWPRPQGASHNTVAVPASAHHSWAGTAPSAAPSLKGWKMKENNNKKRKPWQYHAINLWISMDFLHHFTVFQIPCWSMLNFGSFGFTLCLMFAQVNLFTWIYHIGLRHSFKWNHPPFVDESIPMGPTPASES